MTPEEADRKVREAENAVRGGVEAMASFKLKPATSPFGRECEGIAEEGLYEDVLAWIDALAERMRLG